MWRTKNDQFADPPPLSLAAMSVILQFTADEEAKALPILLRHSPGTVLPNRTYVVEKLVIEALREGGIVFREISPQLNIPFIEDVPIGERI
jgi:hypothetical protein